MQHIKKLHTVGNSVAVVLDRDALTLLGLDKGSLVALTFTEEGLLVTKAANDATVTTRAEREKDLRDGMASIMADFAPAFRKLAE